MEILDIFLRYLILLELISGLLVWIYYICRHRKRYKYAIAPILYVLHALTFLVFTLLDCLSRITYVVWRDILFVHGLLILNLVGIILIKLQTEQVE